MDPSTLAGTPNPDADREERHAEGAAPEHPEANGQAGAEDAGREGEAPAEPAAAIASARPRKHRAGVGAGHPSTGPRAAPGEPGASATGWGAENLPSGR